jgi:hypothetical protein
MKKVFENERRCFIASEQVLEVLVCLDSAIQGLHSLGDKRIWVKLSL